MKDLGYGLEAFGVQRIADANLAIGGWWKRERTVEAEGRLHDVPYTPLVLFFYFFPLAVLDALSCWYLSPSFLLYSIVCDIASTAWADMCRGASGYAQSACPRAHVCATRWGLFVFVRDLERGGRAVTVRSQAFALSRSLGADEHCYCSDGLVQGSCITCFYRAPRGLGIVKVTMPVCTVAPCAKPSAWTHVPLRRLDYIH